MSELAESVAQVLDPRGIEAVGRFVEDEQAGFVEQCLGEAEALTHSQRVFCDLVVDAVGKTDESGDLLYPSGTDAAVHAGILLEVLAPGEILVHLRVLDDPAYVSHRLLEIVCDVVSAYADAARFDTKQSQHQFDGRRFARTVRSEEAEDLAGIDVQRDAVEDLPAAEFFRDRADLEYRGLYAVHFLPGTSFSVI